MRTGLLVGLAIVSAAPAWAQGFNANLGSGLSGDSSGDRFRGELQSGISVPGDLGRGTRVGPSIPDYDTGTSRGPGTYFGSSALSGSANEPTVYYGDSAFSGSLQTGQQSSNPNRPIVLGR